MNSQTPPPIPTPSATSLAAESNPFFRQAATGSLVAPLLAVGLSIFGQPAVQGSRAAMIILGVISIALILSGFVFGIVALAATKRVGRQGIFGKAVAGTCVNGILVFLMSISMLGLIKARERARQGTTQRINPSAGAETLHWSKQKVAGVSLDCPAQLERREMPLTGSPDVSSVEMYEAASGQLKITVMHVTYRSELQANLDVAAQRVLANFSQTRNVTSLSHATRDAIISGIPARRLSIRAGVQGAPVQIEIVFIALGSELWHIQTALPASRKPDDGIVDRILDSSAMVK